MVIVPLKLTFSLTGALDPMTLFAESKIFFVEQVLKHAVGNPLASPVVVAFVYPGNLEHEYLAILTLSSIVFVGAGLQLPVPTGAHVVASAAARYLPALQYLIETDRQFLYCLSESLT